MARRYAPVLCAIWDDDDFIALDPDAQRLYLLLLSQKRLSMVGVMPYAPRNWARGCKATTAVDIENALARLIDARFVVVDDDTDELLVRTMLKHDPPKGAKSRTAMWRSLSTVDSESLRRACAVYIPDEIWDDQTAKPPDDLTYLRNAPSDPPPDAPCDGGSDGARTHAHASARASSVPPATVPPATGLPRNKSSSVLTVVPALPHDDDDDDLARVIALCVDARTAGRQGIRDMRAYQAEVARDIRRTDGELILRMLADGDTPERCAAFVVGYGTDAQADKARGVPWCDESCPTCGPGGIAAWIDTGAGLAPCPNRKALTA